MECAREASGHQDIPLNARGRGQAVQAGGVLADLFKREGKDKAALPFVSSPLGRARQTMELVRGKLELPPADYALDDRLREIGYGSLGRADAGRERGRRSGRLCQAPRRQMDGRAAADGGDLRRRAGPHARLVR